MARMFQQVMARMFQHFQCRLLALSSRLVLSLAVDSQDSSIANVFLGSKYTSGYTNTFKVKKNKKINK